MGIEDLDLHSDEFADRILLVSPSEQLRDSIGGLLNSRSYVLQYAPSIEHVDFVEKQAIWDMVIYHVEEQGLEFERIRQVVRSKARLARASLIVLCDDTVPLGPFGYDNSIAQSGRDAILMKLPIEPARFLVKIATTLRLRKFHMDHARVECEIASQNARLRDLTNRFKIELQQAQTIQRSILPKNLPKHPNCRFAACYDPLEAVGGDLFDIWKISDNIFGLFIGDVTGHGLPAAFIGAMTKMAIYYAPKTAPDQMLVHMANGIADLMPEGSFVTVAAATYDVSNRKLQIAKGGHPNPYIWRKKTNTVEEISARGFPLGVVKESKYQLVEMYLEPGDKFLMVTDGLTETFDMNGNILGSSGIGQFFEDCAANLSIFKCLHEILARQKKFSGGRMFKDDNTLIGMEVIAA